MGQLLAILLFFVLSVHGFGWKDFDPFNKNGGGKHLRQMDPFNKNSFVGKKIREAQDTAFPHPSKGYREWEQKKLEFSPKQIEAQAQLSSGKLQATITIPKCLVDELLSTALNNHLWKKWKDEENSYAATYHWNARIAQDSITIDFRTSVGVRPTSFVPWIQQAFDTSIQVSFSRLRIVKGKFSADHDVNKVHFSNADSSLGNLLAIIANEIDLGLENFLTIYLTQQINELGSGIGSAKDELKPFVAIEEISIGVKINDQNLVITLEAPLSQIQFKIEL